MTHILKGFLIILGIFNYLLSFSQTKVLFFTNKGNFTLELSDRLAPITTKNFKDLVGRKFYDGIIFHRVIDNFMIQGGDPTGTGTGGSGEIIKDEFHEELSNLKTTISMANAGPNTADSQFFINLKDNTYLDFNKPPSTSKHAVFGKVINNFEVVQAIGKVPTNSKDRPLEDVIMDSLRIESPVGVITNNYEPKSIEFFPNPATIQSTIKINSIRKETLNLSLFDGFGKLVYSKNIEVSKGVNFVKTSQLFSISSLPYGIYHLNINGQSLSSQQKIMIQ